MEPKVVNEPLAFHLCGVAVRPLNPGRGAAPPLPPTLLVPPGRYSVFGRTYALAREGLYRFLRPGVENQQRIVYRKDRLALLSAISWLASHGNRDDKRPLEEWLQIALREKLVITCGNISRLGHHFLGQVGVPSRLVGAKSVGKLNNYDMGHSLMEAYLDGRWVLVDLDVKTLFRRRGKRLSLLEVVEAVAADDYEFEPISKATGIAVAAFVDEGYDYGFFMETAFSTEERVRAWYRRIMVVPAIRAEDGRFFTTRTAAQRRKTAEYYPYLESYLPWAEFRRKFYPEATGPSLAGHAERSEASAGRKGVLPAERPFAGAQGDTKRSASRRVTRPSHLEAR